MTRPKPKPHQSITIRKQRTPHPTLGDITRARTATARDVRREQIGRSIEEAVRKRLGPMRAVKS